MAKRRLPVVDSDDGVWGSILNEWLVQIGGNANGGLNYAASDPVLNSDYEGYTYINTADNEIKRLNSDGASWTVLLDGSDCHVEPGTVNGQTLYWDHAAEEYKHTEITEMVWDDTNKRVGVGESSPDTSLHVKGAGGATGITIERTDGEPIVRYIGAAGSELGRIGMYQVGTNGGGIRLQVRPDGGGVNEAVRIDDDGNVLINSLKVVEPHTVSHKSVYVNTTNGELYSQEAAAGNTEDGTVNGQMLYWDHAAEEYKHTEITEMVWDDTNKRLGVGTSIPDAKLRIEQSLSDNTTLNKGLHIQSNQTNGGAIHQTYGASISADFSGTNTELITYGLNAYSKNSSTGTVSWAIASNNRVQNLSTGSMTTATAFYGSIENNNAGVITNASNINININNDNASSIINSVVGLDIGKSTAWVNSGTVNESYAVYIDASTNLGSTTSYALYSESTAFSYLAGGLQLELLKSTSTHPSNYKSVYVDTDSGELYSQSPSSSIEWFGQTTNATQSEIFIDGIANNRYGIVAASAITFKIMVSARDNTSGDIAGYEIRGVIKRNSSNNTVIVGTIIKTVLAEEDSSWDIAVEADDANEALVIKVTGDATNTVKWKATIDSTEVTF